MEEFERQRKEMVERLIGLGILKDKVVIKAMLRVQRELFMHKDYIRFSYYDEPFPIPPFTGMQTISAPHTYPLFYQPLQLKEGDRFLEVGMGSGYGAAIAREVVGKKGLVVTIEREKETFEFGKNNLKKAGYKDIIVINGDGSKGYPKFAPYDKICVTAAYTEIPQSLIKQLKNGGKMIFPVGPKYPSQDLVLLEKDSKGRITKKRISEVIYVPLVGKYGHKE